MKTCPACKTQYSDDTLLYCLQDGATLIATSTDAATAVMRDIGTSPGRAGNRVNVPLDDRTSDWQSQATQVLPAQPREKKGKTVVIAVAVTTIVLVLLFGVIGLAFFAFWRNSQPAVVQNTSTARNENTDAVNSPPTSTAPAARTPITAPNTPSPISTPAPVNAPPRLSSYPSTTRLKFARGAYTTSFSGELNPNDSRSLVLACLAGQTLSATVSGGGSCVTIGGDGASMRATTTAGDNFIRVVNSCANIVHFSISISII